MNIANYTLHKQYRHNLDYKVLKLILFTSHQLFIKPATIVFGFTTFSKFLGNSNENIFKAIYIRSLIDIW